MLEKYFERLLFASRWLLAPLFLGLSLALVALGAKFFQEAFHVITTVMVSSESDMVLTILAMIDIVDGTPPDVGMKLPSTTKRLGTSCA